MKITAVTHSGDRVALLEVEPTYSVDDLKALIEVEFQIIVPEQILKYGERAMEDGRQLSDYGLVENDLVVVDRIATAPPRASPAPAAVVSTPPARSSAPAATAAPQYSLADQILMVPIGGRWVPAIAARDELLQNASLLDALERRAPGVAAAVRSGNLREFQRLMVALGQQPRAGGQVNDPMQADSFDIEEQRRIEEEIRQKNVEENFESAMEYTPEVFGQVVMLYIDCSVNNVPLKAFVDSGAQSTIMSVACAERCNLMRLLDRRFAGMAMGIGSAKILGRVHMAPMKIGNEVFLSSFTILEGQGVDFLLGLDMLRKHQAVIDLRENQLRIGGQAVSFLAEGDIPKSAHGGAASPGGDGLNIGGGSGVSGQRLGGGLATPPQGAGGRALTSQSRLLGGPAATATTAPSSQPPALSQPQPQVRFPEAAIKHLMELGFPREAVLRALTAAHGNLDVAASILLGQ